MNQGDTVIYSQRHFEWLEAAGKWPKHMPRKLRRGTVIHERSEYSPFRDTVQVMWPERVAWHLKDNLELL